MEKTRGAADVDEVVDAIRDMRVRGALDIAVAAVEAMKNFLVSGGGSTGEIIKGLRDAGGRLKSARPSAVSLPNSVDYVLYLAGDKRDLEPGVFKEDLGCEIDGFIGELKGSLEKIAEIGARLIVEGDVVLTHCNSDTVVEILKRAWGEGRRFSVVATETRPRLQGHITVEELLSAGIPVTLTVDSAACLSMRTRRVDKVFVGADTVCANGDVVNKIGTSQVALCAREKGVEFIVAVESIKFSPQSLMGGVIEIEERDPSEVWGVGRPEGLEVYNPAFDVVDADKIDMIITEYGVMPPEAVYQVLRDKFKWEF